MLDRKVVDLTDELTPSQFAERRLYQLAIEPYTELS